MFLKPQHVHFVGIGGIGMSGIAEVLLSLGYQVSGSDLRSSPITDRLAGLARRFSWAISVERRRGESLVVTSALDEDNPEVTEARRLQIPVIPRGEMLAELMRLKFGIAIAGSHGKTTTTSMVASILNAARPRSHGGCRRPRRLRWADRTHGSARAKSWLSSRTRAMALF